MTEDLIQANTTGAIVFDAAAFVALWERCGNVVHWDRGRDGREWFGIYLTDHGHYPEYEEMRDLGAAKKADPDWKGAVIDYLKSRGQAAGWPL